MAIFHLNVSLISRGKGQSAIASASYRSGEKLYSERYDKTSFYARETEPETYILTPKNAPKWASSREKLWNEVEKVERSKNSQLAREITVALPIELDDEKQRELLKEYVQETFVDNGMVADIAIHRDNKENPHAHIMLTVRSFKENGEWDSKAKTEYILDENGDKTRTRNGNFRQRKISTTNWNDKETMQFWRKNWARKVNRSLEINGNSERVTEKSYVEQGINKQPTIHEGYVARKMEKNGKVSERMEHNRQVRKSNYEQEQERKEYASKELSKEITTGLTPKEKTQLKSIAKNLKVYINYDNLIDKQRMVNNWKKSVELNSEIKVDEDYSETFDKISETQGNIDLGKDILEKQSIRIYEKYYPELNKNQNYSTYYKMEIAQRTLENDRVLSIDEIKETLVKAQDNELNYMLKTITKNPYQKPVADVQRQLFYANKKVKSFLNDKGISRKDVHTLNEVEQKEFKQLAKNEDRQLSTIDILNKYYEKTIKAYYPTANIKGMKLKEKEAIAETIDYYGERYSFEKIVSIAEGNIPNKYTTTEQQIGLSYIYKLENNKMTNEDYDKIENSYQLKEIYDTIKEPTMKEHFLAEAENNGLHISDYSHFEQIQSNGLGISQIMNNVNLIDDLSKAHEENLRNELAERRNKNSTKKHSKAQSNQYKKAKNITRL